jgi:hypothetical protein
MYEYLLNTVIQYNETALGISSTGVFFLYFGCIMNPVYISANIQPVIELCCYVWSSAGRIYSCGGPNQ